MIQPEGKRRFFTLTIAENRDIFHKQSHEDHRDNFVANWFFFHFDPHICVFFFLLIIIILILLIFISMAAVTGKLVCFYFQKSQFELSDEAAKRRRTDEIAKQNVAHQQHVWMWASAGGGWVGRSVGR